jgi:hypothetical protein
MASAAVGRAGVQPPVVSVIDGDKLNIHSQRIRLYALILVDQIVSTCPPAARVDGQLPQ